MKNIQEVLDKISAMGSYLEKYMMINWTRILLITKKLTPNENYHKADIDNVSDSCTNIDKE